MLIMYLHITDMGVASWLELYFAVVDEISQIYCKDPLYSIGKRHLISQVEIFS